MQTRLNFFCYLRCQSNVWFLRYWVQPTYFLVILDHFFLFYPLTTPKTKILKKWKECLEILSFYTWVPWITIIWCTVPEIWSVTDRIFCHLGQFFCHFTPLKTWKINILNKWRKNLEILSFYTSIPKIMTICCTVPEIWCVTDVIVVFYFGVFLPFYTPPPSPQRAQKIKN